MTTIGTVVPIVVIGGGVVVFIFGAIVMGLIYLKLILTFAFLVSFLYIIYVIIRIFRNCI